MSRPKASFETLLDQLPKNGNKLAREASSSEGMAGALFVGQQGSHANGVEGDHMAGLVQSFPHGRLTVGSVKINVADFLALLITYETFTPFCAGRISDIERYNVSAESWVNSARCAHYPFDPVHRVCIWTCYEKI